jgi:hypothetical protein
MTQLHVLISSALLALVRARTHCLIQNIGGALRSGIELILGRVPQLGSPLATGVVPLDDASDVDGSEGALCNPEIHMFSSPVAGGASTMLLRRAGVRARTFESDVGWSLVSVRHRRLRRRRW